MADWWRGIPWRMIQTNLREIDMLDIDADRVVADLQSFKATAILINAAGIIASYPTDLSFHSQSPFLQGDSLAEIIDACHHSGIRVLARTDFSKVRRPLYEQHPEWAYKSPSGHIVDYNGDVHVCINGEYQRVYAPRIMEEMLSMLDFDGIFFNMGGYQVRDYSGNYYGICHCDSCQRRFREMAGLDLPTAEDDTDPVFTKYKTFKKQTLAEYDHWIPQLLERIRPDLCIANHRESRRGLIRQESNTAIARPLPRWQYSGSDNTKWVVSSYPEMVSSNTTVDFIDFFYRHVAVSPHQQELRLAQNLAGGGALDYYLIGRLDNHQDRSGYDAIRRMFLYHAANESEYLNLVSKARIGLIHGPDANRQAFRGWFRFLVEHHFLFDTVMMDRALDMDWSKYEAMIIPDYGPISAELAAKVDQYASQGGIVVATGRTGFQNALYESQPGSMLTCLGLESVRTIRSDMRSSYLLVEDKTGLPSMADTDLVYLDGIYVYGEYAESVDQRFRLVPPHNFGPPERCYYTVVTDHPGFTLNAVGQGRALYIPWTPGQLFYQQGHTNTTVWVGDLLSHVLGLEPVGGNLSPMVEVTRFDQIGKSSELLHLVNASGHYGNTFFAPIRMTDLRLELPTDRLPRSIQSLVTGTEYAARLRDRVLTIDVPELGLFDAIKMVWPVEGA